MPEASLMSLGNSYHVLQNAGQIKHYDQEVGLQLLRKKPSNTSIFNILNKAAILILHLVIALYFTQRIAPHTIVNLQKITQHYSKGATLLID